MASIAITGCVAAGKSESSAQLADALKEKIDFNVVSFSADLEAKRLLEQDVSVIQEVSDTFGPDVMDEAGGVHRSRLRDLVFHHPIEKSRLELILHPRIRENWGSRAQKYLAAKNEIFLAEIPLLYEKQLESFFDLVIVVGASKDTVIDRMVVSRKLTPNLASLFLESQWPLEMKMRQATFVIWNDGSKELLTNQCLTLAQTLWSTWHE